MTSFHDAPTQTPPRIILAGVHGFGEHHRANIARLGSRVQLVGFVDPLVAAESSSVDGVPVFAEIEAALDEVGADIVIIATPIAAHEPIASAALRAGADVLLEKPPVSTMADFDALLDLERATGRVVQVGFQSIGSHAIAAFDDDSFELGDERAISAHGIWSRRARYWKRARWAGRRSIDGVPTVDGVATNPLAHAIATALRIAGSTTADSIATVETELYRAAVIDSDDTSTIRITGTNGRVITCALTLAGPDHREPLVTVRGDGKTAEFGYTTDEVTLASDGSRESHEFGRDDLLENLIAYRRDGVPLIVPLVETGGFMRVLEAIRVADEPTRIDDRSIDWRDTGDDSYPVVDGIAHWVIEAADRGALFSEVGAPWAFTGTDAVIARLTIGDTVVGEYRDGAGIIPSSSPRPYLHPLRTRGGVTVTARHPADHDWHNGVGFVVQDVNGTNFWGGRTYMPEEGYIWRDDHGRIVGAQPVLGDGRLSQQLGWLDENDHEVVTEQRELAWQPLGDDCWSLSARFSLRSADGAAVEFGSPGSKGREGGGYGGFFWRLPHGTGEVFTEGASGEAAVHGEVSPWLAWRGRFAAGPGETGDATIVVRAADPETARDPWFVRRTDYPGIGSSIAWDRPVVIRSDDVLVRSFDIVIADGLLDETSVRSLALSAERPPRPR
jgi:predicted dehydrogenase